MGTHIILTCSNCNNILKCYYDNNYTVKCKNCNFIFNILKEIKENTIIYSIGSITNIENNLFTNGLISEYEFNLGDY